ncbi:MAG: hypothetical protein JSV03_17700 [Planctomycetota bacterium]|nr:MAG: hypothetical protein JSV03_17700 [Planctomycetota bacterium]
MDETMQVVPGYEGLLTANGLRNLDAVFQWNQGQRMDKPGLEPWRQRWRIIMSEGRGREHTFYLKRFQNPPWRRQLARWLNGYWTSSTAGIEWHNSRQLSAAGLASVQAIAFGQRMKGPTEECSFILLDQVPGESLERWVPANLSPADRESNLQQRRHLLDKLACFVADFHRAGFVHRDLYLSHIFIFYSGKPADEIFRLIDLQRVFRPQIRRRRWVVKDLAALNFSTPTELVGKWERLRFLCRYVRQCSGFGSAGKLAGLIEAKTKQIARHNK